jgi:hypothetical protein
MDDEKHRILDEARATLARLERKDIEKAMNAPLPDKVNRWCVRADRITAERQRAKAEIAAMKQEPSFDWTAFDEHVQQHVEAAIARERVLVAETLGTEVGKLITEAQTETMRQARDELRELRIKVEKLDCETRELRAALAVANAERSATAHKVDRLSTEVGAVSQVAAAGQRAIAEIHRRQTAWLRGEDLNSINAKQVN